MGDGYRARAEVEGARGRAGARRSSGSVGGGHGARMEMRGDGSGLIGTRAARAAGSGCARADVLGCARSRRRRSPWYPWQDDRFGVAARLYLALADLRTPAALAATHKQNGSA